MEDEFEIEGEDADDDEEMTCLSGEYSKRIEHLNHESLIIGV